MKQVLELFGVSTHAKRVRWRRLVEQQPCPFLSRECLKTRKSQPEIAIGTCTVQYGSGPVIICPYRLLERRQVFSDCLHLLMSHEPGNELHIVTEVAIPGGNVDYFLTSARNRKVRDFVGIEFQTLDTTGTVWPARQRFLKHAGVPVDESDAESGKSYGMNWKMTAKTTLVQLHHKVETFEHINRRFVLVVQDCLLDYMKREFCFDHLSEPARSGDPMHVHAYRLDTQADQYRLQLASRLSTDAAGIARCLGLQATAKVELDDLVKQIEAKLTDETIFPLA